MSETRAISTTSRREMSSTFFFPLQGKAPKKIHAILIETLACFLPGRTKDLPAPLYLQIPSARNFYQDAKPQNVQQTTPGSS